MGRHAAAFFEISNGADPEVRCLGKLRLGPVDKAPRGAGLFGRDHRLNVPGGWLFINRKRKSLIVYIWRYTLKLDDIR